MSFSSQNLRELNPWADPWWNHIVSAAADEIERLSAENARLREALRKLITHALDCEKRLDEFHGLGDDAGSGMSSVVCGARAALAETEKTNG